MPEDQAPVPPNDSPPTTPPVTPPKEPSKPEPKTFDFSQEEQNFLQPRQILINQHQLITMDLEFSMQQYIASKVLPRLAINPTEFDITFNVNTNKVICFRKPPKIIVPGGGNGIIKPA